MIINLTQHSASADQLAVGVKDWDQLRNDVADWLSQTGGDSQDFLTKCPDQKWLAQQLTFDSLPTNKDLVSRATVISTALSILDGQGNDDGLFLDSTTCMIGGAPFFMPVLAKTLKDAGCGVVFAFSQRVSVDKTVDGVTTKTSVFKHIGFVNA